MPWIETLSPSFAARHELASAGEAVRLLESLEQLRERLAGLFPRAPGGLTVVLHASPASLTAANPLLPLKRLASSPAARRYVAGFAAGGELHVLDAQALRSRASNVPGSREMLALTAASLYARAVVEACNRDLPSGWLALRRQMAELRWAWLLEGAARFFAGQTVYAQPAIARRLREGGRPRFPPGPRDALLLGGTVFDLLAQDRGEPAAARLACRLHPQGAEAALRHAFRRPLAETEQRWRAHLARLAEARPGQHALSAWA